MAAKATVDATYTRNNTNQAEQIVRGSIALTGNYGGASTHGDTLSFASIFGIQSRAVPIKVEVFEAPAAGAVPVGDIFTFCPGTTQANGVLNILTASSTEYTQGSAYSAGLLAAVLKFEAIFPINL